MTEHPLIIECHLETMVGVLSLPDAPASTAVIVVVGGPQYRAGSHRQFVQLARALAAEGIAVLRFDARGMGDSSGAKRLFERLDNDIHAAVQALRARLPEVTRMVLWGLCDGAAAMLLYLHGRPGAALQGICLVNPWVRSEVSQARTQIKHYYLRRLTTPAFWRKFSRGEVGWEAILGLIGGLRRALGSAGPTSPSSARTNSFQDRMAAGLSHFAGDVLLILSGSDFTAREFDEYAGSNPQWQMALRKVSLTRHTVIDADHTFSVPSHRRTAENITLAWLRALSGTDCGAELGNRQV